MAGGRHNFRLMNPTQLTPSRPLKWASALLRVALWAVVGVWLVFALTWGVIHGIIVPRIDNWRVELETLATRAVGIPVRIGSIRAQTHGLVPSFELSQVRLLDVQGRDALVLARVLAAVSPKSLWHLGFEQIFIEQPELDVRRLPSGRLEVAGLELFSGPSDPEAPSSAMDWLFAQTELVIRGGQLHWTDDLQQRPRLTLNNVDLVVRNSGWQHLLRLDASPADDASARVSLRADMRSPFLSLHPGRWTDWRGTAYAELPAVDLARLASPGRLAELLGLTISSGQGAMRLWLDMQGGQINGGTADLALTHVNAKFSQAPQALALNVLEGRISLQKKAQGWEVFTGPLTLETRSGQRWPQGKLRVLYSPQSDQAPMPGEFDAADISLAALYELGTGLPLPDGLQHWLVQLQPAGTVTSLKLNWQGSDAGWSTLRAVGKIQGLRLAPGEPNAGATALSGGPAQPQPARPGVEGANIEFDMTHDGGQARVSMTDGHIDFPGVFEDPSIPMDKLSANLNWQLAGENIQVKFNDVRFANADLEGHANGSWHTSDPATSSAQSRYPGVLDLTGQLVRGKGDRTHRYLPLVIAASARAYVKEAISAGQATDVRFHVAGDLWDMPFKHNRRGEFKISAKVTQVDYAFVPPSLMAPDQPTWPALKQADGELVFAGTGMSLTVNKGLLTDGGGLKVSQAKARIQDMSSNPVVEVDASIEGPLTDALGLVNRSPLAAMTGHALKQAQVSGSANIRFGLAVPLGQTSKTSVKGHVTLTGNDVQVTPDLPLLSRARGRVEFSEQGFFVPQASARLAGGDLQFSGGMRSKDGGGPIQFTGQGQATAEGLRQTSQLGAVATLADRVTGSTNYTAQLTMVGGQPELDIQSNLQGMSLALPAPLNKALDAVWPLRYGYRVSATSSEKTSDVTTLTLASQQSPLLALTLHKDTTNDVTTLRRGLLLIGRAAGSRVPLPPQGLSVRMALPSLDADAWANSLAATMRTGTATHQASAGDQGSDGMQLLPDKVTLDTDMLTVMGKRIQHANLEATRQGMRWQGRIRSQELGGALEYRPATDKLGAHVVARLDHLTLTTTQGDDPMPASTTVDTGVATQPQTIPSLDVQVNALALDGLALGHLALQATNRQTESNAREWQLTQLELKVPEAKLSATGNWSPEGTASARTTEARRTALRFKLDVQDSGALLSRFGMPGVFQGGKGQLEGSLGWLGAPYALHFPSLSGQIKLDLTSGQFLKADPGLAKLLGVLSLQSLPRRLALDFRDVFTQGFAFDFVRGDARIDQGVMFTNNLQMKGPNAAVLMEGSADIQHETQSIRALVVPEINAGTASLIATVINPAIGLGTFLAQAILRQPLIQASTQEFKIHGTWADPQVDRIQGGPASVAPNPSR